MKQLITILYIISFPTMSFMQKGLIIHIHNIPTDKGNVMIALYNKPDGFMEKNKTYLNRIVPAKKGEVICEINDLVSGNYAVAVYHDPNQNGKLDKNILGIPTEYYGFSNDARGKFGPPSFNDCLVSLSKSTTIHIHLK